MLLKVKSDLNGYEKYIVEGNPKYFYIGEILYREPDGWYKKGIVTLSRDELTEVEDMEKKFSEGNGNRQIEKIGWLVTFILDHHKNPLKELSKYGSIGDLWGEFERNDPEFLEFYSGLSGSTRYAYFNRDVNQAKEVIEESA